MNTENKSTGKRRGCLGCLGRGLIGLLIVLVVLMIAGALYQSAASASDAKKYPPPGELYDVGEYRLHLYCTGEGSPTVILEAGAGNPALGWYFVQKEAARFTRICSYDRPGYGWSEPASSPLTREQVATTLHQLLETAGVSGPFILVGHSAGGEYIRVFEKQYPSEVLGMVFVDSSHETDMLRYPPKFLESRKSQNAMMKVCQALSSFGLVRATRLWDAIIPETLLTSEIGDAVMSTIYRTTYCKSMMNENVVFDSSGQPGEPASLGDMPLIVLSAGALYDAVPEAAVTSLGGPEVLAEVVRVHDENQNLLVHLSTRGKLIVAEKSGHEIHWYQPELVIDAIREIVEQGRK
ncbi:MAG: alpha/beta hydrolase [Chloroflexi bacterium]|nr:alpha/beta hydrolase [Chloroflexota bacterium]